MFCTLIFAHTTNFLWPTFVINTVCCHHHHIKKNIITTNKKKEKKEKWKWRKLNKQKNEIIQVYFKVSNTKKFEIPIHTHRHSGSFIHMHIMYLYKYVCTCILFIIYFTFLFDLICNTIHANYHNFTLNKENHIKLYNKNLKNTDFNAIQFILIIFIQVQQYNKFAVKKII